MSTGNSPDDISEGSDDDSTPAVGRQSRGGSSGASASYPVKQPQFFQQRRPSFEPRAKRPALMDPHHSDRDYHGDGWHQRDSGCVANPPCLSSTAWLCEQACTRSTHGRTHRFPHTPKLVKPQSHALAFVALELTDEHAARRASTPPRCRPRRYPSGPPPRVHSDVPVQRDAGGPRSPRSPRSSTHRIFSDETNGSERGGVGSACVSPRGGVNGGSSSSSSGRRVSQSRDRPLTVAVSPDASRDPSRTASPEAPRSQLRSPRSPRPSSRSQLSRPRTAADEKETKEFWLTQMTKRDDEIKAAKHELTRINERRAVRSPPRSLFLARASRAHAHAST
jgi:hypothetical protein